MIHSWSKTTAALYANLRQIKKAEEEKRGATNWAQIYLPYLETQVNNDGAFDHWQQRQR